MVFGPASRLGVSLFEETPPLELIPGRSEEEVESIIRAVYRQVLGNAYVMESERAIVPESQFKRGQLSVREFVRAIGKSDLYRSRFFETSPRYRFIELNFKHFLGRTPNGLEEMRIHSTILDTKGFEAEIDSYLDSNEYQNAYGESFVPYYRGYKSQPGQTMVGFTHMFAMLRGASSSDFKGSLSGKEPVLNKYVIQNIPLPVIPPSGGTVGDGWSFQEPAVGARTRNGVVGPNDEGKVFRIEVTAYRSLGKVSRVSKFPRSNKVYLVPFNKLSQEYQRIHRQGGVIASITPV
ncbi:phycobilisome linker polypeptide [Limnoraphis robusta Tam1]|jgi:phycoerythrin-associated linker protein|uniref:Phycobilisome linker polypeptide n=1 Tax=Limnoraphis robusta CCNP1315 TaxID=3110306 RepID=A0ABU5TZE8_9CYAN|nr:phycobilisome linker polypeptide [Limnoraphis robusta]MEA5496031.1 phycobilisome linker polypeptide [Limnoraphis robusta BA-68 BA1]MEA5520307.1 phycobilisome linker polypeptide [Limnoraphis robusta CCNP1315]MEA5542693.1 phycobilisome linker polypeptide [Limnoraphis robusta Tam1]MEA5548304.1 phycobilisome linker polypeptide [Limnoraphis robusta CCNP1324]